MIEYSFLAEQIIFFETNESFLFQLTIWSLVDTN